MRRSLLLLWVLWGCGGVEGSVGELADRCTSCHETQAEEHAAARHATVSPVFEALSSQVADPDFCETCHQAIRCVDCHAAVGNLEVANNRTVLDLPGPVRAPTRSDAPHATARSTYLTSADLCGTCHQVVGPGPFLETVYDRWRASPAAARGETCSDCHQTHRRDKPEIELSYDGMVATIDNRLGGHDFPDGASFLRQVDLVIYDGEAEVTRVALAARFLGWDVRAESRGVPAGTLFRLEGEGDRACIERRRYRTELLTELAVTVDDPVKARCVFR